MSIIEFIRDRARYYNCPVCGRNLNGCEIRILNHQDERFTVQVTCAACQVSLVVVLAIQSAMTDSLPDDDDELVIEQVIAPMGLEAAGIDAAATPTADDHATLGPIEGDEVLEVHLLLKDFEGSFDELLKTTHR